MNLWVIHTIYRDREAHRGLFVQLRKLYRQSQYTQQTPFISNIFRLLKRRLWNRYCTNTESVYSIYIHLLRSIQQSYAYCWIHFAYTNKYVHKVCKEGTIHEAINDSLKCTYTYMFSLKHFFANCLLSSKEFFFIFANYDYNMLMLYLVWNILYIHFITLSG